MNNKLWEQSVCNIQLNKTSFVNGDTVIAQTLHIANPTATPLPIEFKFWFEVPVEHADQLCARWRGWLRGAPSGVQSESMTPHVVHGAVPVPVGDLRLQLPVSGSSNRRVLDRGSESIHPAVMIAVDMELNIFMQDRAVPKPGARSGPNKALQPTAYSLRSCAASASSSR